MCRWLAAIAEKVASDSLAGGATCPKFTAASSASRPLPQQATVLSLFRPQAWEKPRSTEMKVWSAGASATIPVFQSVPQHLTLPASSPPRTTAQAAKRPTVMWLMGVSATSSGILNRSRKKASLGEPLFQHLTLPSSSPPSTRPQAVLPLAETAEKATAANSVGSWAPGQPSRLQHLTRPSVCPLRLSWMPQNWACSPSMALKVTPGGGLGRR